MRTIKQGYVGQDTVRLCQLLGIPETYDFTPTLKSAVIEFQKNNNLVQDGIVGPKSWLKLFRL